MNVKQILSILAALGLAFFMLVWLIAPGSELANALLVGRIRNAILIGAAVAVVGAGAAFFRRR